MTKHALVRMCSTTSFSKGGRQLTVSGVEEVESFDENSIVMDTIKGVLIVRGKPPH